MSKHFRMAASHSVIELEDDPIFKANAEAQIATKKFGESEVVNASIGALLDDQGGLCVIPTVIDVLRNLEDEDFSAYAPIAGTQDFLESVKKATFGDYMPEGYLEAVSTPGGSGAVRNTVWNYTEFGDTILTADWYWAPYKTISESNGRKIDTFKLFDDNYNFNIDSFKEKVEELLNKQDRILVLFNFPANNPTGYNLSSDEWDKFIQVLKNNAKDSKNKITIFIDIAYIDYCNDGRGFMKKFSNLPENILVVFGFSMSKGYTLYGMRCGAMIGLSSNEKIVNEFRNANEYSSRGTWSNCTRSAMTVLSKIFNDDKLFNKVEAERAILNNMLNSRVNAFAKEANKCNLNICPYKSGFFISIPCKDSPLVVDKLKDDNIFLVPIPKGMRFAVCSVSEEKCRMVPEKIKKAINK